MYNICFLVGSLNNSGGTERVCSIIANELVKLDYNVTIASIKNGDDPYFELSHKVKTHSLTSYSGRSLYKTPIIIHKIRQFLIKEKYDCLIVVESMSVLFTLPALIGLDIKHICWEHFNFNSDLGKSGRRIARQLAARFCDAVVTLTERDRRIWMDKTNHNDQIISIPNPSPFTPQNIKNKADSKTVLSVGRLTYQKGFDLLLKSWVKVNKDYPDWKLLIVGEGEDRLQLEILIKKYNLNQSVNLMGKSNNMEKLYNKAAIYCMSSRFEGFPMVLLEAIAFGLPIVSFDCDTGPSEVLEETDAILVPPLDTNALAEGLIKLISDIGLRDKIAVQSIAKSTLYTPNTIVKKWDQVIKSLINE